MAIEGRFQIGEVAEAVGLSIRTIRHYDETGVVEPSGRSAGGFRLYTDHDIERLRLVKQLKPLTFTLEEIQELVALLDDPGADHDDRLSWFAAAGEERCTELRQRLEAAESVLAHIRDARSRRSQDGGAGAEVAGRPL